MRIQLLIISNVLVTWVGICGFGYLLGSGLLPPPIMVLGAPLLGVIHGVVIRQLMHAVDSACRSKIYHGLYDWIPQGKD